MDRLMNPAKETSSPNERDRSGRSSRRIKEERAGKTAKTRQTRTMIRRVNKLIEKYQQE